MNLRNKFNQFMLGRYGTDSLSRGMMILALALYVLNWFVNSSMLSSAFLLLLILCYFRMFSRNVYKRAQENQLYLQKTAKLRQSFYQFKNRAKGSKTHHIYKCPKCKQKIRVPRGKGRISIHCPKCNHDFIKKS